MILGSFVKIVVQVIRKVLVEILPACSAIKNRMKISWYRRFKNTFDMRQVRKQCSYFLKRYSHWYVRCTDDDLDAKSTLTRSRLRLLKAMDESVAESESSGDGITFGWII